MRNLIVIFSIMMLLASCAASNKNSSSKILPASLKKDVQFGMSLEAFKMSKKGVDFIINTDESFRDVYIENVNHPEISNYVYYFDTDDDKPLYEIIINYKSEELRDKAAESLFGAPNFEGGEWRFKRPDSFNVMAWTFKTKLIIVALLPKTEWYEDPQGTW